MKTTQEPEKARAARIAHTPGPWGTFFRYVLADGRFIATAHAIGDKGHGAGFAKGQEPIQDANEAEANARLIAAAPCLLEALQELVELDVARNMHKAQAAIRKATGV